MQSAGSKDRSARQRWLRCRPAHRRIRARRAGAGCQARAAQAQMAQPGGSYPKRRRPAMQIIRQWFGQNPHQGANQFKPVSCFHIHLLWLDGHVIRPKATKQFLLQDKVFICQRGVALQPWRFRTIRDKCCLDSAVPAHHGPLISSI